GGAFTRPSCSPYSASTPWCGPWGTTRPCSCSRSAGAGESEGKSRHDDTTDHAARARSGAPGGRADLRDVPEGARQHPQHVPHRGAAAEPPADDDRASSHRDERGHDVADELYGRVRGSWDEGQIVEITLVIGMTEYFNRFNNSLGVEPTK